MTTNYSDRLPLVMLTNDDGYGTPGIEAMVSALETWAGVMVIAPELDQSACSHRFTFRNPLYWKKLGRDRYCLDGTPVDCVYVGIFGGERISSRVPDLVVSGLNSGCNLGLDTYYSGTVAAAREAAIRGLPGLAVSADRGTDLCSAARLCSDLAACLLEVLQPSRPVVLNVNVPANGTWKLCRTRLGRRAYGDGVQFRRDSEGRECLWLGDTGWVSDDLTPGTDTHAVNEGLVSVTGLPLTPSGEGEADGVVDAVLEVFNRFSKGELNDDE